MFGKLLVSAPLTFSPTHAIISWINVSCALWPIPLSRGTTYALGNSVPRSRETIPITATSAIFGCFNSMASSSAGATWNPLYLINSFSLSTILQNGVRVNARTLMNEAYYICPCLSIWAISPVRYHPSVVKLAAVAIGLFQYPLQTSTNQRVYQRDIVEFVLHHCWTAQTKFPCFP